ncbi:transcription elongation factor GreAB [Haloferula sp. A504]|uniref:transcription elongation factor GreAB n=1 Tax=Haloferula sp. A504 TaxID=3373601 RepID=UPI0031C5ADE7|nr:hypothetical protein [Verrucomicrobiaceae bacterium E54]
MGAKSKLLDLVRQELRKHLERLSEAAQEAHAAATDPDSRAEGKYDTRSLEASYLAEGQARQVEGLAEAIRQLGSFEAHDLDLTEPIVCGALVETERDGETEWFLLLPAGGGHEVEHEGRTVTLLGPESPLYRNLIGKTLGDSVGETGMTVTEIG